MDLKKLNEELVNIQFALMEASDKELLRDGSKIIKDVYNELKVFMKSMEKKHGVKVYPDGVPAPQFGSALGPKSVRGGLGFYIVVPQKEE